MDKNPASGLVLSQNYNDWRGTQDRGILPTVSSEILVRKIIHCFLFSIKLNFTDLR